MTSDAKKTYFVNLYFLRYRRENKNVKEFYSFEKSTGPFETRSAAEQKKAEVEKGLLQTMQNPEDFKGEIENQNYEGYSNVEKNY